MPSRRLKRANTLGAKLLTNLSARLQRGMTLSIAHRMMDEHVWTGALRGPRLNKEEPNPEAFRLAQREAMPLHATGPRIPAHPYQSIKSSEFKFVFLRDVCHSGPLMRRAAH